MGGPSLGLWETTRFTEGAVQLRSGDRLVAFTSGVAEAWATEEDIAAEAALARILHNWRNESANEIASLIVDNEPETGPSKLDRIAAVASVDSPRVVANRRLAERQLVAVGD